MLAETDNPIRFNRFKHHLNFIIGEMNLDKGDYSTVIDGILPKLKVIGHSTLDLYTGKIAPEEIKSLITGKLKDDGLLSVTSYRNWVMGLGKDFKLLMLPDKSEWTLRWSENTNKYIHIHPARYSDHTVRVHANALKTAIATVVWCKKMDADPYEVENINYVRQNLLDFQPVKSFSEQKGTGKIISQLTATEQKY